MNMPGSTWFLPISDSGWINSALINMFDFWHTYLIDEWNGGRPAGTEKWIKEGMLELPSTIAASEQGILQGDGTRSVGVLRFQSQYSDGIDA
jgi:hypothetical protein